MACLLRLADQSSKGVVSFTTQEHPFLLNNEKYQSLFNELKKKYHVGLHFNWHNFSFKEELKYDFLMAGENDLIDLKGQRVKTLNLDACNFSPAAMDFGSSEKHWDILYVARGVFFKGIEHFFDSIRALYDSGNSYRVLFLCPAPPDSIDQTEALIATYEKLFTLEERKLFNFLVLRENYPFFFDLPTLSHFYRSSRVFVHTADEERRCRVAAYAFCSGLPVVGRDCVGSILSDSAKKDVFFEVKDPKEFSRQIIKALNSSISKETFIGARKELSETFAVETLKSRLQSQLGETSNFISGTWFTNQLDIRLGRHHGFGKGPNSLSYNLESLMNILLTNNLKANELEKYQDVESQILLDCDTEFNQLPWSFKTKRTLRGFASKVKARLLG